MKFLGNLIFHVFSNTVAILAAAYFIAGFTFTGSFVALLVAAVILTLINLIVRPVLKLILGPFIILTLGLFIIVLNAITLYFLDFLSDPLIIEGILPLLLATLLFSAVNGLIGFSARQIGK
jgi:putative membrane protein